MRAHGRLEQTVNHHDRVTDVVLGRQGTSAHAPLLVPARGPW
jgi:hypothetical protein